MRSTRQISLWVLGFSLVLGSPISSSWAQPSKRKSEQQAEKIDIEELKQDLASRQESRVVGALNLIKESQLIGGAQVGKNAKASEAAPGQAKEVATEVEKLLANGSTVKISLNALRVLAALEQEASSKTIAPYVRHRSTNMRQTAAKALLKTGGPIAVQALSAALRAPDRHVRDIAARGLGGLGAKGVVVDLFKALDQRVFAAAVSIGKLCSPAECLRFMDRLGKVQLDVITSGADEILFRPEAEVDEKAKLAIIERLAGLRTLPATEYLADVYKRWPEAGNKSLKKALGDAVEDNGGDLGEDA